LEDKAVKSTNEDETTIDRLIALGTVTYEATGWGTGIISIKCRSNTKCELESLNKALITLKASEDEVQEENLEEYVVNELEKKLAANEIHILTVENKKYNIAKRKFKVWKNNYKNQQA
jgi:ribonuclease HI